MKLTSDEAMKLVHAIAHDIGVARCSDFGMGFDAALGISRACPELAQTLTEAFLWGHEGARAAHGADVLDAGGEDEQYIRNVRKVMETLDMDTSELPSAPAQAST